MNLPKDLTQAAIVERVHGLELRRRSGKAELGSQGRKALEPGRFAKRLQESSRGVVAGDGIQRRALRADDAGSVSSRPPIPSRRRSDQATATPLKVFATPHVVTIERRGCILRADRGFFGEPRGCERAAEAQR